MLSQLKARDHAPAPTAETAKQETVSAPKDTKKLDEEQQWAADRLTCDALCSLANGISGPKPSAANAAASASAAIPTVVAMPGSIPGQPLGMHGFLYSSAIAPVAVPPGPQPASVASFTPTTASSVGANSVGATNTEKTSATKIKSCPKQHQLPLFLSKTYHMIDRCDPSIATWSATGDNFVVKNVEKFASSVLPRYFKHSNFSSFARQLNFYGFRKLRSDPILTNDVDPQTACYVRFYHEKFQKNKPELLHNIKRATKSDQQSKDDVEDLKSQVFKLKKCVLDMSTQMDRKISEINFEYNRRISGLTAEYDKLASLVGQLLQQQQHSQPPCIQSPQKQHLSPNHMPSSPPHHAHYVSSPPPSIVETTTAEPNTSASISTSGNTTTTSSSSLSSTNTNTSAVTASSGASNPVDEHQHKMQSLSQAVTMSLVATGSIPAAVVGSTEPTLTSTKVTTIPTFADETKATGKRTAPEQVEFSEFKPPSAVRPKMN